MRFSQKIGKYPVQKLAQIESIDDDLRVKVWNVLQLQIWDYWEPEPGAYSMSSRSTEAKQVDNIIQVLWFKYFNKPLDTIPAFKTRHGDDAYNHLRTHVLKAEWYDVFDLIEEIIQASPERWREGLTGFLNHVLESENSGYRLINEAVTPITDKNELQEVGDAAERLSPDATHIRRALELMNDRKNPDFRNSIKESISAVESVCKELTNTPKGDLGECLRLIKKKKHLHPAFEQSLMKLYAYTSDGGGIRHALTEEHEHPKFADAKFMLVTCSALVNYLRAVMTEK